VAAEETIREKDNAYVGPKREPQVMREYVGNKNKDVDAGAYKKEL
jgi:hypothetical protein